MEGRRLIGPLAKVGSSLLLGLGAGCAFDGGLTQPAQPTPPVVTQTKDDDLPKRTPSVSTCLAIGNLGLQAATSGVPAPPGKREQDLDKARRSFQKALELDPNCLAAYSGLAATYQAQSNYDKAKETYQRGLKQFPKDASLWFELGMCEARHQDWGPALECLKVAVSLDPENRTFVNMLGFGLARTGHYEESYFCFKKIHGESQAHYNLARMLHHLKQDEASKQQVQLALNAKPDFPQAKELFTELEGEPAKTARPNPDRPESSPNLMGLEEADVPNVGNLGTVEVSPTDQPQ